MIEQEGQSRQYRLFTDREGAAPAEAADVCEVILSSLSVRRPRQFGSCWLGSRLWQELKLDEFFGTALQDRHGTVEWAKVIELLTVNRLCDPESELGVHQPEPCAFCRLLFELFLVAALPEPVRYEG